VASDETLDKIAIAKEAFRLANEIQQEAERIFRETVLDSDLTVLEKAMILGLTTARIYQLRPVGRTSG